MQGKASSWIGPEGPITRLGLRIYMATVFTRNKLICLDVVIFIQQEVTSNNYSHYPYLAKGMLLHGQSSSSLG